jgi:hypothetical protein
LTAADESLGKLIEAAIDGNGQEHAQVTPFAFRPPGFVGPAQDHAQAEERDGMLHFVVGGSCCMDADRHAAKYEADCSSRQVCQQK